MQARHELVQARHELLQARHELVQACPDPGRQGGRGGGLLMLSQSNPAWSKGGGAGGRACASSAQAWLLDRLSLAKLVPSLCDPASRGGVCLSLSSSF